MEKEKEEERKRGRREEAGNDKEVNMKARMWMRKENEGYVDVEAQERWISESGARKR